MNARAARPTRAHAAQQGLVLIGLLVALMLAALAAVNIGQRMVDQRLRERESDLLWVGGQYRRAIESYWRQSPGNVRTLPARLEDLVQDPRFPQARRHLRKLYADPMAPDRPWGLVKQGNALLGVYSQAEGEPMKRANFDDADSAFGNAASYSAWRFVAKVTAPPPAGAPGSLPPKPGQPLPNTAPRR